MPEPSLNAACPCGSGKKYKRCCYKERGPVRGRHDPPGPRGVDEGLVEQTEFRLVATMNLPAALNWDNFDFGVDIYDPVFDDLVDLFGEAKGRPSEEVLIAKTATGLFVHGTAEVRAGCAEELEHRLAGVRQKKVIESGQLALAALADPEILSPQIGVLLTLYYRYVLRRLLERGEQLAAEEKRLDSTLVELAKKAAEAGTIEAFEGLSEKLRPLGPGALPYIEHATAMDELDESVAPIVRIAEAHPSVRSARILSLMLEDAVTNEATDLLCAALSRMPAFAWPILLYKVHGRKRWAWLRTLAAEPLVRARVWEVYEPLVFELCEPKPDEAQWEDDFYTDVAELLARLGDRRAVGRVLFELSKGRIPKAAESALKSAWADNGWWAEVDEGLEARRVGKRILIESGVEFKDLVRQELAAAPLSAIESANFRTGLVQEDWNNAYQEDIDWLRPNDLAAMGPRETELMKEFAALAEERIRSTRERLEGKAATEWLARLQDGWSTTPQEKLGGRAPLAVILDEKRRSGVNTGYCEKYLRRRLAELCAGAREALAQGDPGRARSLIGIVLDLEPEHPFGRRLLRRLE